MYLWVETRIRWFNSALFFCRKSSSKRTLNSFSFTFFLELSTCCCFGLLVINRIQIHISIKIIQHFSQNWQVFIFFCYLLIQCLLNNPRCSKYNTTNYYEYEIREYNIWEINISKNYRVNFFVIKTCQQFLGTSICS